MHVVSVSVSFEVCFAESSQIVGSWKFLDASFANHPSQYYSYKREESMWVIVEPALSMLRQQEIHLGDCWAGPFNVGTTSFQKNLETKLTKKLSGKLGLNIEGPRPTITWNHNGSTLKGRGPQEPKIVTAVWIISSGLDRITLHRWPKWISCCLNIEGAGSTITQMDSSRLYE